MGYNRACAAGLAQLVRALALQARSHWFESSTPHQQEGLRCAGPFFVVRTWKQKSPRHMGRGQGAPRSYGLSSLAAGLPIFGSNLFTDELFQLASGDQCGARSSAAGPVCLIFRMVYEVDGDMACEGRLA